MEIVLETRPTRILPRLAALLAVAWPAPAPALAPDGMLAPPERPVRLEDFPLFQPAPNGPATPGFALSEAPLPPAFGGSLKPLTPAPAPAAAPAVREPPPERTASLPSVPVPVARPVVIPPAPSVAAPAPAVRATRLSAREIVERANAYFTHLSTLVADFTQIGGDGRRLTGTLYLQRPGKLRFDYDRPATLEVIADGASVAVRDRKLATQDLYSIGQTPLKFLLRERVQLGQDIRVVEALDEGDGVRIALEDSSTLGGTSRITLYFDPKVETLSQWRIVDPQGFLTTVIFGKAERGRRIDQSLFAIDTTRILGNDNK